MPLGARPHLAALVLITAVGAVLRFATLDLQSFGHDEAVTVGRVLQPGLDSTLETVVSSERTPHLYYALAWLWTRVFGEGEVGVRSFSALVGTLTIPATYAMVRAMLPRGALVAAAVVAVHPFLVYYSQEARTYALLVLLGTLSLWALALVIATPSRRRLTAWAVLSCLALAAHYFAGFLVAAEAVLILARVRPLRTAIVTVAPVAVAAAVLLPLAIHQAGLHSGDLPGSPGAVRALTTPLTQFALGERLVMRGAYTLTPLIGLVVVAFAAGGALLAWRRGERMLCAAIGCAAVLVAIPYAVWLVGPNYFNARNVIAALTPLIALLAATITVLRPSWHRPLLVVVLGGWLALSVAPLADVDFRRLDYRGVADAVKGDQARAWIVPAGGDDPLLVYRSANGIARAANEVRADEVIVVSDGDAMVTAELPGFTVVRHEQVSTLGVTVLHKSEPGVLLTIDLLAQHPASRAQVLAEP